MLKDQHIRSVEHPECELDESPVEPDHTHRILIDEQDPIPGVEYRFSWWFLLLSRLFLPVSSSFFIVSFLSTSPFLISNPRYLYAISSSLGISWRDSGRVFPDSVGWHSSFCFSPSRLRWHISSHSRGLFEQFQYSSCMPSGRPCSRGLLSFHRVISSES